MRRPAAQVGVAEAAVLAALLVVISVSTWSLALAQLGHHDGLAAVGLGAVTSVLLGVIGVRAGGPVIVRFDRAEVALALGVGLAAAVMFLPGAPYALADKDPGVYVAHAFVIARDGDVTVTDPVLERMSGTPVASPGAVYPGFWIDENDHTAVTPQFYHLYPATLATAIDVVGSAGAWNLNPLLAILSTLAVALALRRAAGTLPAALAGGLLAVSMLQVWQAKYPTTEILAQLLLAGAVLAAVVALDAGWSGAAALAGLAVGTGFLARPDGVLYVLMAVAGCAVLYAIRCWDVRSRWFVVGVALALPYALWNAFGVRENYTLINTVPRLSLLVMAVAAMVAAGVVGRVLVRRVNLRATRTIERSAGVVLTGLAAVVLLFAWFRSDLLGYDYTTFGGRPIRSFNEMNLRWLANFFSIKGLMAMWCGIGVLLLRRWKAPLLLVVVPGLALLPLYLWDSKISPRMMWWGRRFIPGVVPAMIVLIALFLAWAISNRRLALRLAGAALALVLTVEWLQQSLPLRGHREMAGSYTVGEEIASAARGARGVFLFTWPTLGLNDPTRNFPGPVWFIHDQITSALPPTPTMADVDAYRRAFPDNPIFVVSPGVPLPDGLDRARLERVHTYSTDIPVWQESVTLRPSRSTGVHITVDVYRLSP